MCFCSIFRFTFSTELRCYFWSALFVCYFSACFRVEVLEKKKGRIKWYRKMVPVFYILIWWGKSLKIEMVLFFSIFSKAKSPHKVLVNTLETVSAEVCFGLFFASFLCFSIPFSRTYSLSACFRWKLLRNFELPSRSKSCAYHSSFVIISPDFL